MPNKKTKRRLRHERRREKYHAQIEATKAPSELWLSADGTTGITIEAAEGEGDSKLKRFKGIAYTGGAMRPLDFYQDIVVDLSGLTVPSQKRPILMNHDSIVGHSDLITVDGKVAVEGVISGVGEAAAEVVGTSANGFPWQMSIGAAIEKLIAVDEDEKVEVNGRTFTGPILVARKARLGEISFVALGADDQTSVKVAASAVHTEVEVFTMEFEAWVEALGLSVDTLADEPLGKLQAKYDAEMAAKAKPAEKSKPEPKVPVVQAAGGDGASAVDDVSGKAMAKALGDFEAKLNLKLEATEAEATRRAEIRKVCAGKHDKIEVKALADGWTVTKAELEVLRAERPKAPAAHTGPANADGPVLEAAMCLATGKFDESTLEADYGDKVMEAAHPLHQMSIPGLFNQFIRACGGTPPPSFGNESIRMAFQFDMQQRMGLQAAGFTSYSLSGVLGAVAYKSLLQQYQAFPSVARVFAATSSVKNFQTHTRYRMTMTGEFEEVGSDGELKHGSLDDASYTVQAKTYGKIVALTRKDIINDDLGAFLQIPRALGRAAAHSVEKETFTIFMANGGSFFASGNSNLNTTNPLAVAGLTTAVTAFMNQTDANSMPIMVMPAIVLVPTTLDVTARQLYVDTEISNTVTKLITADSDGAVTKEYKSNPYKGLYKPLSSPWLENASLTGYATDAWYLLADPADVPAIEIAFLNGNQTPTIESGDVDFNQLGIQYRAYFDYGVAYQDYRGAQKNTA